MDNRDIDNPVLCTLSTMEDTPYITRLEHWARTTFYALLRMPIAYDVVYIKEERGTYDRRVYARLGGLPIVPGVSWLPARPIKMAFPLGCLRILEIRRRWRTASGNNTRDISAPFPPILYSS